MGVSTNYVHSRLEAGRSFTVFQVRLETLGGIIGDSNSSPKNFKSDLNTQGVHRKLKTQRLLKICSPFLRRFQNFSGIVSCFPPILKVSSKSCRKHYQLLPTNIVMPLGKLVGICFHFPSKFLDNTVYIN